MEVIGLFMLTLVNLLNPSLTHNNTTYSWKRLSAINKEDALRNCEKRYSSLLYQTLNELTDERSTLTLYQLSKRLELFQSDITATRNEGKIRNSSAESFKASLLLDNTNLKISNALMISNIVEESGIRISNVDSQFITD